MKKVIAAVVFMLLVAVFAQFGASDVAFANDGKTMPPKRARPTFTKPRSLSVARLTRPKILRCPPTRNCRFPRLTERRRTTS